MREEARLQAGGGPLFCLQLLGELPCLRFGDDGALADDLAELSRAQSAELTG